jgi:DNA-binding Lrp family transcriptional regulator
MDEIDSAIIAILGKNSRTPFSKIAKELGVGTDTIFRRFKNLVKQGVIDKPSAILDAKSCGYEGIIDFLVTLKPGSNRDKVNDQLALLPGVYLNAKTFGDQDLYFSMFFRNFEHIVEIVKKLRQIDEIVSLEPLLYVSTRWTIPAVPPFNKEDAKRFEVGSAHSQKTNNVR